MERGDTQPEPGKPGSTSPEQRPASVPLPDAVGEPAPQPDQAHAVFERIADLERQLQEFEAKRDRRREQNREASRRWRRSHPEESRSLAAERRRRQKGDPPGEP
jgi:hypothetical protein